MKLPNINKPCSNCPFRKDCPKGWLGEDRITDIINSESFTCHKTTELSTGRMQCAGFMLIKDGTSEFEILAKHFGYELLLSGKELVFDSQEECIQHHKNK